MLISKSFLLIILLILILFIIFAATILILIFKFLIMVTISLDKFDFSKSRVRFDGKVQDKCDLSYLIHQVALMAGNRCWPLYSDIYWDSALYSELRSDLLKWISRL